MERMRRGWIRGLVAFLAAVGISPAASGGLIDMPAGSTVWIEAQGPPCSGGGGADCAGSNLLGVSPPNGIPLSTFSTPSYTSSYYAEVLPHQVRAYNSTNFSGSFLYNSFVDTYTVHGSASGTFSITVTLAGSGTGRSALYAGSTHALSGNVNLEIGSFSPGGAGFLEQFRVTSFGGTSVATQPIATTFQPGPFQVPIALSATHTRTVQVGDSFDLAYGVNLTSSFGAIDMDETGATISFDLPEGVWITSEQGAVFGDPPAPQVPLPPFAAGLAAASLVALGCRSLRRTRNRSRGR
jgi:hypothetical protein